MGKDGSKLLTYLKVDPPPPFPLFILRIRRHSQPQEELLSHCFRSQLINTTVPLVSKLGQGKLPPDTPEFLKTKVLLESHYRRLIYSFI